MTLEPKLPTEVPEDLALPAQSALFLDIDGTLAEIVPRPDMVEIPENVRQNIKGLQSALGGAVAILSGRNIQDIDRLLPGLSIAAAGSHGLEQRITGTEIKAPPANPHLERMRNELEAFASAHEGILIEDKGRTIAVHYRQCPQFQKDVEQEVEHLLQGAEGLTSMKGKMVVEIKPGGWDKGTSIRAFMAEAVFSGRKPIFIGDDVTDEAGFAAIQELNGLAIRVGCDQPTYATYCLPSVTRTQQWIADFAAHLDVADVRV